MALGAPVLTWYLATRRARCPRIPTPHNESVRVCHSQRVVPVWVRKQASLNVLVTRRELHKSQGAHTRSPLSLPSFSS